MLPPVRIGRLTDAHCVTFIMKRIHRMEADATVVCSAFLDGFDIRRKLRGSQPVDRYVGLPRFNVPWHHVMVSFTVPLESVLSESRTFIGSFDGQDLRLSFRDNDKDGGSTSYPAQDPETYSYGLSRRY